jgi:heat shock protein HtpX
MMSGGDPSLRRRLLATVLLFVACLGAFLALLAILFGHVVPDLVDWWGQRYDLQSQTGLATVVVVVVAGSWMTVGVVRHFHVSPLAATKAQHAPVDDYPDLHAAVERLAADADLPKPTVNVLPTRLPNAFTVGLTQRTATVVVTTGLLETLDDDERDAVLAHELAHVRNRDAAVMTVGYFLPAAAFAFAKALTAPFGSGDRPPWSRDPDADRPDPGEAVAGAVGNPEGTWTSSVPLFGGSAGAASGAHTWSSTPTDDDGGDAGNPLKLLQAVLVVAAIVVLTAALTFAVSALFWVFASLVLVLLARPREYAADAGAVELTGDPEAFASALRTLDGELSDAPAQHVRQVDGAVESLYVVGLDRGGHGFGDVLLLSDDLFPRTHPEVDARIERVRGASSDT